MYDSLRIDCEGRAWPATWVVFKRRSYVWRGWIWQLPDYLTHPHRSGPYDTPAWWFAAYGESKNFEAVMRRAEAAEAPRGERHMPSRWRTFRERIRLEAAHGRFLHGHRPDIRTLRRMDVDTPPKTIWGLIGPPGYEGDLAALTEAFLKANYMEDATQAGVLLDWMTEFEDEIRGANPHIPKNELDARMNYLRYIFNGRP